MKDTLVFAGSYEQFKGWVRQQLPEITEGVAKENYVFVQHYSDIVGRRDYKIVTIGTYYKKEGNMELLKFAEGYLIA